MSNYSNSQVGPPPRGSSTGRSNNNNSGAMVPAHSSFASNNPHVDDDDEIIPVDPYQQNHHFEENENTRERYRDEEQDAEPEQPRYKYSSQNMARANNGRWRKCCCVALMFLIFIGFSIGLTFLINYLFFSEDDGTGNDEAAQPYNLANETFVQDKTTIDAACSESTYNQDGGTQCQEVCEPQFSACCQAFREEDIVNGTTTTDNTNSTDATTQAPQVPGGGPSNATQPQCSLETDTRGCVSYSKCIAAMGMDPAPTALPRYCEPTTLETDPSKCETLCDKYKCCYEQDGMHCLGKQLDMCVEYAPCQNLRTPQQGIVLLEPAPPNLDQLCYYDTPDCHAACKLAECCNLQPFNSTNQTALPESNVTKSCFADNVVSCLTYAACSMSNKTRTQITMPRQFSVLPKLPSELKVACDERGQEGTTDTDTITTEHTCEEHCNVSSCCTSTSQDSNCFLKDPLGCLAWDQHCQVNRFQLGTPPS